MNVIYCTRLYLKVNNSFNGRIFWLFIFAILGFWNIMCKSAEFLTEIAILIRVLTKKRELVLGSKYRVLEAEYQGRVVKTLFMGGA